MRTGYFFVASDNNIQFVVCTHVQIDKTLSQSERVLYPYIAVYLFVCCIVVVNAESDRKTQTK